MMNTRVPATTGVTNEFHMLAHDGPVPQIEPLLAECFQVGLSGVQGAQHNPSVVFRGEELWVCVRVLNDYKSTNYIARVAPDWTLLGPKLLAPSKSSVVRGPIRTPLAMQVPAVEDLRLFEWQGKFWAIACTHTGAGASMWIRQVLLELSADGGEILQVHHLPSARQEKNWMPCISGDDLLLVYSTDPLITVLVPPELKIPGAYALPHERGHVRGGSQLVPFGEGYLAIVHEVYKPLRNDPGYNPLLGGWAPTAPDPVAGHAPVVYVHRFARFDSHLRGVELSRPFYFRQIGIEFCAGLAVKGERMIASFGVADREAWLAEFSPATVDGLFADVATEREYEFVKVSKR